MTAAHTPGPWESSVLGTEVRVVATQNRVCKLRNAIEWSPEEQIANARLIAAAPQLAEALRELMAVESQALNCPQSPTMRDDTVARFVAARAALAAAGVAP